MFAFHSPRTPLWPSPSLSANTRFSSTNFGSRNWTQMAPLDNSRLWLPSSPTVPTAAARWNAERAVPAAAAAYRDVQTLPLLRSHVDGLQCDGGFAVPGTSFSFLHQSISWGWTPLMGARIGYRFCSGMDRGTVCSSFDSDRVLYNAMRCRFWYKN